QIAKISGEVERDRQRLVSSCGRRDALHECVDPYLALMSPIRRIPPEVFMACLPTRHAAIMHASSAPLLLGRVCAAWRAVSLSTARLWSSVHVVLPIIASDPAAVPSLEGLRIWLRRSGECPLSIAIFVPPRLPK
ncbi:hypothetical protein DFH06DRAFT_1013165, partial [Mycena polygramma]